MLRERRGRAVAIWLALVVVVILAAGAFIVWANAQPVVLHTISCPVHPPGTTPPPYANPICG